MNSFSYFYEQPVRLLPSPGGGELEEKIYTYVCFRLGMHFSYALIAETDSGHHTVIYNSFISSKKKKDIK